MAAIVADLTTVLGTQTPPVKVAAGWPSTTLLQGVATPGAASIVSVFDSMPARDSTRWITPILVGPATGVPNPGITATIASAFVPASHSTTLTIAGTPSFANGDAASFMVTQVFLSNTNAGIVYVTQSGDTLNTFAANLAAAINTAFSGIVSASAAAGVITITNLTTGNIVLGSNVGAGATLNLEVRRAKRNVGIHIWGATPAIRDTLGDLIESRLSALQFNFGYNFSDGTWGRVTFQSDVNVDDNTLQDVYRRDFSIGLDYGVTIADQLYTVLLTQNNITAEPAQ